MADQVIFYNCLERIHDFKSLWNELATNVPSPVLTYDWIVSAAEAFHAQNQLCIGILQENNHLKGVLPLACQGSGLKSQLRLIGIGDLGEPGGVLSYDSRSFDRLLGAAESLGKPLFLERIPLRQAHRANNRHSTLIPRGFHFAKPSSTSCFLPITSDWETYWRSLPSKRRYDLRRAKRRAASHGKIHFSIKCPSKNELEKILFRAYRVESRGWKGHNLSSIASNKRLESFFTQLARRMQTKGYLRIGFLSIDSQDAAMLIGLVYANRFWLLKIGYDQRWKACSPGILLITESIRRSFKRQLESYEFLGTYEHWLRTWVRHDDRHHFGLYAFYPMRLIGLSTIAATAFQRVISFFKP